MPVVIETKQLTKIFKKTVALDGVNLAVKEGEIFAVLGPNGAGKTTFLKILASLILPDRGEARIYGLDVVRQAEKSKRKIALVMGEERGFYSRLTGRQNLEFFAALYHLFPKKAKSRIEEAASLLELEGLDKIYQYYSTGMKNRLALARAFLNEASILLLDEPTRSLDPLSAHKLKVLLKKKLACFHRTVVFTTHNTLEAEEIADRIAILDKGKLKVFGAIKDLGSETGCPDSSLQEIYAKAVLQS